MDEWITTLTVMIIAGIIGAISRQFGQWIRDKKWPGRDEETPLWGIWWAEVFLGGIAGWIAWELTIAPVDAVTAILPELVAPLLKLSRLLAWAFGFIAPDYIEMLASRLSGQGS